MGFVRSTPYEDEQISRQIEAGDFTGSVALHRYVGTTMPDGTVSVHMETNDDNDDGFPDGEWVSDDFSFKTPDAFVRTCGICRIGISGVIVTVTLDGEEIRNIIYVHDGQSRKV